MNEKLPSVFANEINHEINNSKDVFYSANDENEVREVNPDDLLPVEIKINRIFNSDDFVYKKRVMITTDNGDLEKVIIGKSGNGLLTMDNELIDIALIRDIKKI